MYNTQQRILILGNCANGTLFSRFFFFFLHTKIVDGYVMFWPAAGDSFLLTFVKVGSLLQKGKTKIKKILCTSIRRH